MRKTLFLALTLAAPAVNAADIDNLGALNQREFRHFSEDLGAALSYKALAPAEPLGVTGFDIGVEVTSTRLGHSDLFERVSDEDLDSVVIPKVHAHKGLPFGIDVGLMYATVPDSNVDLVGAELRYALVEGGVAMPAVAVRGTWSRMDGVDQLDLETRGLELTVSKGFAMLTPYAGVGQVWVDSDPNVTLLNDESFTLSKYYAGANLALGLLSIGLEAEQMGDTRSLGGKFALRW